MEFKYWLILSILGAVWGSAFIFIKIAAPEFGAVGLVQTRLLIASLVFLPVLFTKKYFNLLKPAWKHSLVLAVTNNAIPFTLFSFGSFGADSNILAILNATTAFNTMIIAFLWLGEKVTTKQIFGLILGFIGVIILVNPESSSTSIFSAILCLIGAACYSFSTVFIQKYSNNDNLRKKIAKNGQRKYLKFFNSKIVADFIINKTLNIKASKKYFWYKN